MKKSAKGRSMKHAVVDSIREEVQKREKQVTGLDDKVLDFSSELVKTEIVSQESFIKNEYFLQLSQPAFALLGPTEQVMHLALWFYQRNRSVPGNDFKFEHDKDVHDVTVNFLVSFQCGKHTCQVAVECGATPEKQKALEAQGLPVLNFTPVEVWRHPLECAEKVYSFLDNQLAD